MLSYRFTVNGREVHGEADMQPDAWRGLSAGKPLVIRYVPETPEVNRPAEGASGPLPTWMPWLTTLGRADPSCRSPFRRRPRPC